MIMCIYFHVLGGKICTSFNQILSNKRKNNCCAYPVAYALRSRKKHNVCGKKLVFPGLMAQRLFLEKRMEMDGRENEVTKGTTEIL
jgi:hypothetical protein